MKTHWFAIVVVFTVCTLCGESYVEAGEQKLTGTFSGSLATSLIDPNSDGMPAIVSVGRSKTNLGLALFQTVGESAGRLSEVKDCPQGNSEFPLLMSYGAVQFDDSGDQLIVKYTSGVTCFDPIAKKFTSKTKGVFEGGTGKFAKASGSIETISTGYPLVVDPAQREFHVFSGQFTGTLVTP